MKTFFSIIATSALALLMTGCGLVSPRYGSDWSDYRGPSVQNGRQADRIRASRAIGEYMEAKADAILSHSRDGEVRVISDRNRMPALQVTYSSQFLIAALSDGVSNRGGRELDYVCKLMSDEKHVDVSIIGGTRDSDPTKVLSSVNAIKRFMSRRGVSKSRIVEADVARGGSIFSDTYTITFFADKNLIKRAEKGEFSYTGRF